MTVVGERKQAILAQACRDSYFDAEDQGAVHAALKLHGQGLLARDPKSSRLFYPTKAGFEADESTPSIGSQGQFQRAISSIRVGHRLRTLDPEKVAALKASIPEIGLRNPISVYGTETDEFVDLSAGEHRLEAMRQLGHETVPVVHFQGDDLDRELWEIDENLIRSELTPADRALFVFRRKEIYLLKHPETAHGAPGVSRQVGDLRTRTDVSSFVAATSEATGQSERAVQRDAERGEKISERALRMLSGTPLNTGVTLDRLKKLPAEQQVVWIEGALADRRETQARAKQIRTEKMQMSRTIRADIVKAIADKGTAVAGKMPRAAFPIGYVDAPWEQEAWSDETGQDKGLMYPPMPLDDIKALCAGDKSPFTPDAVIWFWVPFNRIDDGIAVLEAWGFEHVSAIVWDKVDIGMGRWVRDRAEMVLIGKRGKISLAPEMGTQPPSLYSEKKGEHSRKPVWFAEQLDQLYPDMPKLELFQRKESLAEGDIRLSGKWSFWGFEASEQGASEPAHIEIDADLLDRALAVLADLNEDLSGRLVRAARVSDELVLDMTTAIEVVKQIEDLEEEQRASVSDRVSESSLEAKAKTPATKKNKQKKSSQFDEWQAASRARRKAYRATIPATISDDDLILAAKSNMAAYDHAVRRGNEPDMVTAADKIGAVAEHVFGLDPDYEWTGPGGPPKGNGRFACMLDAREWLMQHLAAPIGEVPMFGQPGRFLIEISGCRVDFRYEGLFSNTGGNAHVVDLDKPFFSETGYRNFYIGDSGFLILPEGRDFKNWITRACVDQLGGDSCKKPIKLYKPPFGLSGYLNGEKVKRTDDHILEQRKKDPAWMPGGFLHARIASESEAA